MIWLYFQLCMLFMVKSIRLQIKFFKDLRLKTSNICVWAILHGLMSKLFTGEETEAQSSQGNTPSSPTCSCQSQG